MEAGQAEGRRREAVSAELTRQLSQLKLDLSLRIRDREAVAFLRGQIDGTARTAHLLGLLDRELMNTYLDAAAAAANDPRASGPGVDG